MSETKDRILMTALRLFAQDGYEATSVSRIAGELGMTKGALYKHYKNKRDIFDSIFEQVCRSDIERSQMAGIPEEDFSVMPQPFCETSVESVRAFIEAQFDYWAEDETACNFRKLLTLEQYRNSEMAALYQKVFGSGPVSFIEDLFREMMQQGLWREGDPLQMAVAFYAPFYLLLSVLDTVSAKDERAEIKHIFRTHTACFIDKYALEKA